MIETDRLYIRELEADDWMHMQRIALDFRQSEYVIYDMPLPIEDEEIKSLTKRLSESKLFFAVFLKDKPDMIGYVCFHNDNGIYDLGYCFHSYYQKKGYGFESCKKMLEYMEQKYEVKQFTAGTALENEPSCKLLGKLGFVLNGTEELSFHEGIVFEGGKFVR